MKHVMKITVSRKGEDPISIAQFKKLSTAGLLFGRWFGKAQQMVVIVPEDTVKSIEIKEVKSRNANQS